MRYLIALCVPALVGIVVVVVMGVSGGWSGKAPEWVVVLTFSLLVGGMAGAIVWRALERRE